MENGVFVMIVFVSLGSFAMIAFIVWLGVHAKNRKATLQAEVQTRLIDKFSNAPEFVNFLNSDIGKQFLSGIDKMPKLMARDRIVGGVSRGIIMLLLGVAFLIIWRAADNEGFLYPGFILAGLGIGFFISTLVSLKLSQKFGLIGDDSPTSREVMGHVVSNRESTETQA
jgi:hypothetical protein